MRRFGVILLAVFMGCMQISLRGLSPHAVVPNLAIVTLVVLLNRWSFEDLAIYAISLGVVLEVAALTPTGTQIIACLLIVLVGKVVLRQASETSQAGFLIVLGICITLAYNLATTLALSSSVLASGIVTVMARAAVESVYNVASIAFGYFILFAGRETVGQYKLPRL